MAKKPQPPCKVAPGQAGWPPGKKKPVVTEPKLTKAERKKIDDALDHLEPKQAVAATVLAWGG